MSKEVGSKKKVGFGLFNLVSLWLLSSFSFAQAPVTVSVGESLGPVPEYAITGFNHGVFMRVLEFQEDFAGLDIDSLRYPPGNIADESPLDRMHIADYGRQWQFLGEPPVLVVTNLFTGSAEAAGRAVVDFEDEGIPVLAFEVGNEPDLYGPNRADESWTPEKYCDKFREYRAVIKAVDPNALVAGPAVSGADIAEPYLKEFLRLCGDVVDVLTWHIYPTDGSADDDVALATSSQVTETIRRYREWVKDPETNPLGFERDIQLGITEFGLSWRTNNNRHLMDTVATLWLADALGRMVRERLDMSHYFALQGTGGHGLIDNADWRRPTFYLFEMLSDFTGEVLSTSSSDDALRAYAVGRVDTTQVLLVNMSTEAKEVTLELPETAGGLELKTLSDDTYEVFVDEVAYQVSGQAAAEPVTVPARAVVLVTTVN